MKSILFICIGDSKIIGDSLGPVIGSELEKNKKEIEKTYNICIDVLGTINNPLIYGNIERKILSANKKQDLTVIIDSALGGKEHIGEVILTTNKIEIGTGINTGMMLNGDIIIKGIIAEDLKNTKNNIYSLSTAKIDKIELLSKKVMSIIYEIFYIKSKYKNVPNGNNFYIDNI